jgi:hypothetical protein
MVSRERERKLVCMFVLGLICVCFSLGIKTLALNQNEYPSLSAVTIFSRYVLSLVSFLRLHVETTMVYMHVTNWFAFEFCLRIVTAKSVRKPFTLGLGLIATLALL